MARVIYVPADDGLARLLRSAAPGSQHLGTHGSPVRALANTAERPPGAGARAVEFPDSLAVVAEDDLTRALARAREDADPAADALEALIKQFRR